MKHAFVLAAVLSALCVPAFAQSVPVTPVTKEKLSTAPQRRAPEGFKDSPPDVPPAGAPQLTDAQVAAMLCQTSRLMKSVDSAEYKPGVDAYGRPVAPADGNEQTFQLPDRVDIPINIDILKTVGAITTPTPDLTTNLGSISVFKGGQVQFNGHDLTNNVTAFCAGHPIPTTPPPFVPAQPQPAPAPKG